MMRFATALSVLLPSVSPAMQRHCANIRVTGRAVSDGAHMCGPRPRAARPSRQSGDHAMFIVWTRAGVEERVQILQTS